MEDERIIALFEERSEQAIAETEKKYGAYCHRIAYGVLRNAEDAGECVNDTYLRAWNSIPPMHPENFAAYLGKLTRNLSIDRERNRKRKKRGGGQTEAVLEELEECIPSTERSVEQRMEDREIKVVIERFFAGEAATERIIFVQRYWYLLPIKEIARNQGMSQSKVTSLLYRQRKRLKAELEKEGIWL